jgi:hypothetical protein
VADTLTGQGFNFIPVAQVVSQPLSLTPATPCTPPFLVVLVQLFEYWLHPQRWALMNSTASDQHQTTRLQR